MPSDNFPFAVGRVRVLESSLLDAGKLARLRELPFGEAVKQLSDWGYAAEYPVKTDPDGMIAFRRAEVRALIADLTPKPQLTDLFYLDIDATNVKLLMKNRLLGGENYDDVALAQGVFDPELLRGCVNAGDYEPLGAVLDRELRAVDAQMKKRVDPRLLSAGVDNAFFSHILAALAKEKNAFCLRYFTGKIDFANLLSVLRARELGWDETDFRPMIIPGGQIPQERLLAAVSGDEEEMGKQLFTGDSADAIRKAVSLYKGGSLEQARDLIEASQLALAEKERYDAFGIGPIAYFLLASEAECRALRVLFAKKRTGAE